MANVIYDVDLATDVKSFILTNLDDISFSNSRFKDVILDSPDDSLLRIGKVINSPLNIVSVDIVNATFFKNNLFKDGNQD